MDVTNPQVSICSVHVDKNQSREDAQRVPHARSSPSLPLFSVVGVALSTAGVFVLLHGIERWLGWPALDWKSVAATGAAVGLVASIVALLTRTRRDG